MPFKKNIIAIVYDFDGTLSPQSMHNYGVLPALKIRPEKFWSEVTTKAKKDNADQMLCYMHLLLEKAKKSEEITFKYEDLRELSKNIKYFRGVKTHFKNLKDYVKKKSNGQAKLRFYLISGGLKEILQGIEIYDEFENIFASEYYYDNYGKPTFAKILVNDTIKTQYLFRINKGKEFQYEKINEHMPEEKRPIPFRNIIYVGDGTTDVPGMAVTIKNGGHSIAVYEPKKKIARKTCMKLFKAGRVHHIAPADFRGSSELMKIIKLTLDLIIRDIIYSKSIQRQKKALSKK